MRASRKISKLSFWQLPLFFFCLLFLSAASLWAEDLPDPVQMTDQQIFEELESLLEEQLTTSQERQESLQNLRTMLQGSQLQLQTLQNQLKTLQQDSTMLQSSLSGLSLSLELISTELRESERSLLSLSEDIARQSAKAKTRETVLICVCGISLGAVIVMLVSGLIRN